MLGLARMLCFASGKTFGQRLKLTDNLLRKWFTLVLGGGEPAKRYNEKQGRSCWYGVKLARLSDFAKHIEKVHMYFFWGAYICWEREVAN